MNLAAVDDPQRARHGDADWLSLALIDARNHTLRWLAAFDGAADLQPLAAEGLDPPHWRAGHAGWWQGWWIVRNVQAQRGESCDATRPRLAPLDAECDAVFDPAGAPASRWQRVGPSPAALRQYLADTLEATLELLGVVRAREAGPDALHFYRLALWHEDRLADRFAEAALALGSALPDAPWPALPARADREPLWWPAQRMQLGARRTALRGAVPAAERWAHEVAVPEFEIDAQAVSWARFAEFAEDGGYDDPRWWSEAGRAWLAATGARAPRHVEQLRGGVIVHRGGRLQRVPAQQPAAHLTRHEAEAWCRWAGRRLPTEVEWELAAVQGASRGFVWGDVFEWTGGRARWWPGGAPVVGEDAASLPAEGSDPRGVLRGSAASSRPRQRHASARQFVAVDRSVGLTGFRSCAP